MELLPREKDKFAAVHGGALGGAAQGARAQAELPGKPSRTSARLFSKAPRRQDRRRANGARHAAVGEAECHGRRGPSSSPRCRSRPRFPRDEARPVPSTDPVPRGAAFRAKCWSLIAPPIELNVGRETLTLEVANTGDRPLQVGSHYHFFETNLALSFERQAARGFRLTIPAGTACASSPGNAHGRDVCAAGARKLRVRGSIMGALVARSLRRSSEDAS